MTDISLFVRDRLIPALYNHVPELFPEHRFQLRGARWVSNTYLTGEPHKRIDKTVICARTPGLIMEQGGEMISIIEYMIRRDHKPFIQTIRELAGNVGLTLPEQPDFAQMQRQHTTQRILEDANDYFQFCLYEAKGERQSALLAYLSTRGYTVDESKEMELGFIPSKDQLYKYLIETRHHDAETVNATLQLNHLIGRSHSLSIPYRVATELTGFKFRSINPDDKQKYMNSTGLKRSQGFFNLQTVGSCDRVVIVEGELDALHATAKGLVNVVATGGSDVHTEQIEMARQRGITTFVLCLDRDSGWEQSVKRSLAVFERLGVHAFVAELPLSENGKTDPDRFITDHGVEAFARVLNEAVVDFRFTLHRLLKDYPTPQLLTDIELQRLLSEVLTAGLRISQPAQRALFIGDAANCIDGITAEVLEQTLEQLRYNELIEKQRAQTGELIGKASELLLKGSVPEALQLMREKSTVLAGIASADEIDKLLEPVSREALCTRLLNHPPALSTGFYFKEDQELTLPSGALTVVAAPTGHGKTTMLQNLLLRVAERNAEHTFLMFSYEEDADTILLNTLNTYIGTPVAKNNREAIREYMINGSLDLIFQNERKSFVQKVDEFFNVYSNTGRVRIVYSDYDIDRLCMAIRHAASHLPVGAVFIDYIQLINLSREENSSNSRQEEMKLICTKLKDVAVETGLPVVLGAQFNREVTAPWKLHPTRIGEAGDIERVANQIIGLWNFSCEIIGSKEELSTFMQLHGETDYDIKLFMTLLKLRGGKSGGFAFHNFHGNESLIIQNKII